jgi:hypothetical protein
MFTLITLLVLIVTALTLIAVRVARPGLQYSWLIAAGGALIGWISILFWQMNLPAQITLTIWEPQNIFSVSPALSVDAVAWAYALSLGTLALAIIITAAARWQALTPVAWAGTLLLTALGLIAVLAGNPLTLALAWTAIDLTEFVNMIRTMNGAKPSERAVTAFSARVFGTGLLLWAGIISAANGASLDFQSIPPSAGFYLLLAAGLRLGVLPLHLPYIQETSFRRGFGTALRLIPAASSLILLARILPGAIPPALIPYLLGLNMFTALYGGWKWLRAPNELDGRPYWLIGMASLAVNATLRGNPTGAAAWGLALILFGGMAFLYSAHKPWLTRLLIASAFGLTALPFSLTASASLGSASLDWLLSPLYWIAQALLAAGFIRHLTRASEASLDDQPRWAQATYPIGMIALIVPAIGLGLWGWPGAWNLGYWIDALIVCGLILVTLVLISRIPALIPPPDSSPAPSQLASARSRLANSVWAVYRFIGRVLAAIALLLEGDGGLLWTVLLLVLFIAIVKGTR